MVYVRKLIFTLFFDEMLKTIERNIKNGQIFNFFEIPLTSSGQQY